MSSLMRMIEADLAAARKAGNKALEVELIWERSNLIVKEGRK